MPAVQWCYLGGAWNDLKGLGTWKDLEGLGGTWKDFGRTREDIKGLERTWKDLKALGGT